jgi:hypothetical protein
MAASEIEKLERRYAENPQGLTFAPLAEVHRKNGDVPRALELLRAGLELHPNYIPASIVLGRCHWDAGDLPAAEAAFAHVLRLDDENVIALKSLAEINERLERFGEAQRWLNRLLSVDRSNEEARQQLTRLETAKQAEKKALPPSPAPEPVEQPALPTETAASLKTETIADKSSPQSEPAREVATPELVKAESPALPPAGPVLDLTAVIAEPASDVADSDISAPATPSEPDSPAIKFLDTGGAAERKTSPAESGEEPVEGLISAEFVPPKESTYRAHPELTRDFVDESQPPPSDIFEQLEVETVEEVELQSSGGGEFRVPNAADEFMDLTDTSSAEPRRVVEQPLPEPSRAASAPSVPAAPVPEALETVSVEPSRPSYSVRDTKGQSVASFFATLLASRPSGSAESGPASETASASSPSGTASKEKPTVAGSDSSADVSFDEFFGGAASESGQGTEATSEAGKDDLDQFQTWLQNLKR